MIVATNPFHELLMLGSSFQHPIGLGIGLNLTPPRWVFVRARFTEFLRNLSITADQANDGDIKRSGIVACLNRVYWNPSDRASNHVLIGSWAKQTRTRPPRDVDLLFVLPLHVYHRFGNRHGNIQSQLLQEVRDALITTYPSTEIRADGQVVCIRFNTYQVELAPAFHRQGGGFLVCDTNNGGQWKHVDPAAELAAFELVDSSFNGNLRKLARLLKQWQRHCEVPIKSFHLEALVKGVLPQAFYGGYDEFWFDWLVRDAFALLTKCAHSSFIMPGTGETIYIGDAWVSRARSAYEIALKACSYEYHNQDYLAGLEWQKIFGPMIPMSSG